MGLFSRKQPETKSSTGMLASTLDITKPKQVSRNASTGEFEGWVYGITNLVSNAVASQPLKLYATSTGNQKSITNFRTKMISPWERKELSISADGDRVEQVYGHPAQELLKVVNNYTDGFNLMYLTSLWMDLLGDCYWLIQRDTTGTPSAIHLLNPVVTRVVPNAAQTDIRGYLVQMKGGKTVKYRAEDVIRFSMPNPNSRWYGISPLIAQSSALASLHQAEKLEFSLMKNAGVPPMILKYSGQLSKAEMRVLETEWRKATTGNKSGNVKVLDADFSTETIAMNLQEMMMTETKVFNLKALALAYGIPYSMIDSSDQKKAGLDQLLEMQARNSTQPRLTRIQEVLNQQYVPMFDDSGDLMFGFDDPSPDAPEQEAKTIDIYVKRNVITINEAREILGLAPKADETVGMED
jgi:HK97 family phage portal protein